MPRDLSNPRKFDPVASTSWCFLHAHWEPIYENNYRVCANCGHSSWTERALIIQHNAMLKDEHINFDTKYEPVNDASLITACPLCGNEWGDDDSQRA